MLQILQFSLTCPESFILLPRMSMCFVAQLCLTLCYPGTVTHQDPLSMGILQARRLEWVAMTSSRGSS